MADHRVEKSSGLSTEEPLTLKIPQAGGSVHCHGKLREVTTAASLDPGTGISEGSEIIVCINLPNGTTNVELSV